MRAALDNAAADHSTASSEIIIRRANPHDLPLLEWFGSFRHHRSIIRETYDLQCNGQAIMFLAAVGAFPVGQAWLDLRHRPRAIGPKVWAVRVIQPMQAAGIGARLMRCVERVAGSLGQSQLELGVEKYNRNARRFYEHLDWKIARELKESYDYTTPDGVAVTQTIDEWIMVKRLFSTTQPGRITPHGVVSNDRNVLR
jgi:GNAT superfamily N-acetyltransferase